MQLSAIRDECRLRFGVSSADQLYTDNDLTTLVNAAIRTVNLDQDWPWLETATTAATTVGTNALTLASNIRRVVLMAFQNQEIRYFTRRAHSDFYTAKGSPRFYTYNGGWKIYPEPDKAYTLDYTYVVGNETALSADTDEPLIPDYGVDAVISRVCVMMSRRARDLELERNYFGEWARTMDLLRDEIRKTHEGQTPRRTRIEDRVSINYTGTL